LRDYRVDPWKDIIDKRKSKYLAWEADDPIYKVEKKSEGIVPKDKIISFKNGWKFRFDVFVLILAIFNGIYIPLKLSFNPPEMNTSGTKAFDILVDFIFISDIVLGFFVSYVDRMGQEVF
tara:strand:+ start:613 stop:972 length:360 start_codon:yes stop_codon:yes gene_type:complete